jgi:hypothetical protein
MQKVLIATVICFIALGFTRAQDSAVPNDKLSEIMKLLPVPENPDRVTETDWNEFETREKMIFPEDFKAFINVYGCGKINNTLEIMAPMCLRKKGRVISHKELLNDFCDAIFGLLALQFFETPLPASSTMDSDEVFRTENAKSVERSEKLVKECNNLASQFYANKQYPTETPGRLVLEDFQEFIVADFQKSEPDIALLLKDFDLSEITFETKNEDQYLWSKSATDFYSYQLREFLSTNSKYSTLQANQIYLWGNIIGSIDGFGWLIHKNNTSIYFIQEKTLITSFFDLDLIDTDFLDVLLRILKRDQTLLDKGVVLGLKDSAFNNQKYEFVPNPNRRTP